MVLQDIWSLMALVSQDRFHSNSLYQNTIYFAVIVTVIIIDIYSSSNLATMNMRKASNENSQQPEK